MIRTRICGIADIDDQQSFALDTMISLLPIGMPAEDMRPGWIAEDRHHVFSMDDVESPYIPGAPRFEDAEALVRLGRYLAEPGGSAGILIHCVAGVSRSTATGFILHCIELGPGNEEDALQEVVRTSVSGMVCPNGLIVSYADAILGRNGEMVRVVDAWKSRSIGFWGS